MDKCHCSGIKFEKILEEAEKRSTSYKEVAKELKAGHVCTACREDMSMFCENRANKAHTHH